MFSLKASEYRNMCLRYHVAHKKYTDIFSLEGSWVYFVGKNTGHFNDTKLQISLDPCKNYT